ncbi:LysM peptidoglycan-binding domain-containing protein [Massilia antarctica]|uniref:LysM peptidoglycan-binding domain-containing protein n=1 Tax=Massilia antarctica TaxID=2765360 RepID=A0AA49A5E0_9BURK|nr:LysM domain-containing protein [Massilia antarctica]QPI47478.1 LysM peptidoglycan-binding domain-containing protein [Massilia antarctica]
MNQGKGDGLDRDEMSYYVYDNADHILSKLHDDGHSAGRDRIDYMYAQGNAVAETGTSIKDGSYTVMDSKNYALFQNFDKEFPSGGMQSYTVKGGESLQNIADSMYGNASLWYLIADANGLSGNETLKAGQVLRVPSASQSGTIDSAAHKVYSDSEIIGSKLPNLKSNPPKKSGCSSFLQVLVIIVAIVASCILGPQMLLLANAALGAGAVATVAAAALTGAAVSVVTQVVSIALDLQDGFSWKAVAKGALAGAITAGIAGGGAVAGESIGTTMLNGAIQNIATQGVNMITGDQKKFSWRSVAAAGLTAGVTKGLGDMLNTSGGESSDFSKFATSTAESITKQLVMNGKVDWRSMGVNLVMTQVGSAIGGITGTTGVPGALGQGLIGAIGARLNKQDAWAGAIGGVVGSAVGQLVPRALDALGINPRGLTDADKNEPGLNENRYPVANYSNSSPDRTLEGNITGILAGALSGAVARWMHRDENVASETAKGVGSSTYDGIIAARRDSWATNVAPMLNRDGNSTSGPSSYQVGSAEYNQAVRNGEIEPSTGSLFPMDANGTEPGLSYLEKLRAAPPREPISFMPDDGSYTPVNHALASDLSFLDAMKMDDAPQIIPFGNMMSNNLAEQMRPPPQHSIAIEGYSEHEIVRPPRAGDSDFYFNAGDASDAAYAKMYEKLGPDVRYIEGGPPVASPFSNAPINSSEEVRKLLRDPEFANIGIPRSSGLPVYSKAISENDYSLKGARTLADDKNEAYGRTQADEIKAELAEYSKRTSDEANQADWGWGDSRSDRNPLTTVGREVEKNKSIVDNLFSREKWSGVAAVAAEFIGGYRNPEDLTFDDSRPKFQATPQQREQAGDMALSALGFFGKELDFTMMTSMVPRAVRPSGYSSSEYGNIPAPYPGESTLPSIVKGEYSSQLLQSDLYAGTVSKPETGVFGRNFLSAGNSVLAAESTVGREVGSAYMSEYFGGSTRMQRFSELNYGEVPKAVSVSNGGAVENPSFSDRSYGELPKAASANNMDFDANPNGGYGAHAEIAAPKLSTGDVLPGANRVPLSFEDSVVVRGDASRAQIVQTIGDAAQPSIASILRLDPNARIGFRGSLVDGLKNETKLGVNGERVAFDGTVATKNGKPYTGPQGYDADFFVVSDDLAAQFSKKTFFKDVTKLDGSLKGTFQEFGNTMQRNPILGGMKTELPSFRVYTTAEMAKKSGSQYYFLQGGK